MTYLPDRFWEKVIRDPDTECWEWVGARSNLGYGRVGWNRRVGYTHRVSYEAHHGPVPADLELDHLCRNPGCCNPAHLEPVTHAENMRRAHPWSPHGTRTAYRNYRCRCDECRQANTEWHREYRARRLARG